MLRKLQAAFLFIFSISGLLADVSDSPPLPLPVKVETSFYLLNFESIREKEEIFTADVYFKFKWKDPRLSFTPEPGEGVKTYLEEGAVAQLNLIWWPQIEFLNSGSPTYNNRALFIYPDGMVEYYISITGDFRTHLDLSHFPFDRQPLKIMIDSFLWNKDICEFVPTPAIDHPDSAITQIHDKLGILSIKESVETTQGLNIIQTGESAEYSTYIVTITTQRISGFFILQVFIPLILVFGISCAVFFSYKEPFLDRIMLSLTSLLVFLAAKFTINQDLPQIGYMTIIDKAFLVAYISLGISVIMSILEKVIGNTNPERSVRIEKHARWIVPLLFVIAIILIFSQWA